MNRINVFIPSAGLGERLRPITEHIPKPLLPILGKPILEIVLEKVSALPVNRIGINLYHKKEEIKSWIEKSAFRKDISIFQEDSILGTGGALKNAEGFLKETTFLVHNSDIISDIDLESIVNIHLSSGNIATLAVLDYPEINNVIVNQSGAFVGVRGSEFGVKNLFKNSKMMTFTGIAVYSPEFLRFLPEGKSSVVDGWLKAIGSGAKIVTVDVSGSYPHGPANWMDIGTPEAYMKAVFDRLKEEGEKVYIHKDAMISGDINIDGYVVIEEGCILDKTVSLKNTIVLSSPSPLPSGERMGEVGFSGEDCIIGQGYKIDVDIFKSADKILIGSGGSDRNYFRVKRGDGSVVLMETREPETDFERHIEYTRFFENHSIPVPRLIESDHKKRTAFFEDLGDLTLYSWLKCPRREDEIERLYRHVIDILVRLHTEVTRSVSECPLLKERVFDYEHLRWETDYFMERFVKGIRNIDIKDKVLKDEFHRLALKVDSFPKTVIHRDFQSQNIMIQRNDIPRVVDYQGARIGPPAYDLVSLVYDPYYRLDDGMRERLVDYYIVKMETISPPSPLYNPPTTHLIKGGEGGLSEDLRDFYWKEVSEVKFNKNLFRKTLLPCRLQRHMQALGAYGFLSMIKGKKYFLKHVPEGLRLLKEDVSLAKNEYPEIYKLVSKL